MKTLLERLIFVGLVLQSATLAAQSGRTTVSGLVEWDREPVECTIPEELTVELRDVDQSSSEPLRATTRRVNPCGVFYDFGDLSMGRYQLMASASGYRPFVVNILAPSDSPTNLHLFLERDGTREPCGGANESQAFRVHGAGTRAGEEGWFRLGEVFSFAGSEGGSVRIRVSGVCPGVLTVEREQGLFHIGEYSSATEIILATSEGHFLFEHQGINVTVEEEVIEQVGVYRIEPVGSDCFRVVLLADIPEYMGE